MQNEKTLEVNYIIDKLKEQANIENQSSYKLDVGDKVGLIESKHTMTKTRYNATPFYFVISNITGKLISISAADISAKTVTRSRTIPIKSNEMSLPQAKTILGTSGGSLTEILNYNPKKDTYKVRFEVEDDKDYIHTISAKKLRANKLLKVLPLELEYFDKNKQYNPP
jgi:hypothetical protein